MLSIYSGLKIWGKTSQVSKRMLHRRNILNLPLNGQICNKNITVGKIAVKEHIWKDIWTLWRGVNFSRRLSFTSIVCLDLCLSISSTKSKMTAADQKLFQWTSNCSWPQVFLFVVYTDTRKGHLKNTWTSISFQIQLTCEYTGWTPARHHGSASLGQSEQGQQRQKGETPTTANALFLETVRIKM